MGALVLASVFFICFLSTGAQNVASAPTNFIIQPIPVRLARQAKGIDVTKGLLVGGGLHSAIPTGENQEIAATNFQSYGVPVYKFSSEDAKNANSYGYEIASNEEINPKYGEYASIEVDVGGYNNEKDYLDTNGYTHYKTATSFNLEGPRQLETITSHSYQKEVEPYDVSGFQKSHDHKEEEQHAEVHYHQHKHLHKHNHKQDHTHKHEQEHKHDHDHKHDHHAQHEHKHEAQHKHSHLAEHKHHHKAEHQHRHHQEHKHSHYAQNKHEHKHHQEHKHDHRHGHKHHHQGEHKHSHHAEHKHDHHHGHKHENRHHHRHEHKANHKHHHEHKDEHKHRHHSRHHHKHSHDKYY